MLYEVIARLCYSIRLLLCDTVSYAQSSNSGFFYESVYIPTGSSLVRHMTTCYAPRP